MQSIDLNLLRVLDVMLEERSVTRTAARLGLTQSAVSHALNRLRYALGDELFVRVASGMQPTPRAVEMGAQVHAALVQLQAALAPSDFSPAVAERRFTLVAGSYPCAVLAPALVDRLSREAPLSELAISPYTPDVFDRMDAHRIDFLVSGIVSSPARFAREVILSEDMVWVIRADHPLIRPGPVSLAELASVPHIEITPPFPAWTDEVGDRRPPGAAPGVSEHHNAFETALAGQGLVRRVGVTLPDTYSAIAVVLRSDMAVAVPRRLAENSAMGGRFRVIEPPYETPSVELSLIYLKDRLVEPAVAWMRGTIRDTARSI
jgi:DNA-binding transcriptional LysR family regulator